MGEVIIPDSIFNVSTSQMRGKVFDVDVMVLDIVKTIMRSLHTPPPKIRSKFELKQTITRQFDDDFPFWQKLKFIKTIRYLCPHVNVELHSKSGEPIPLYRSSTERATSISFTYILPGGFLCTTG